MKKSNLMSSVENCLVTECAYNRDQECHARAITVGNGGHAKCDTFLQSSRHVASDDSAGVGGCKSAECEYNEDMECRAKSIRVDHCQDHADCVTFEPRKSSQ